MALRAGVRPAAEHRVPGVRRIAAELCPLLWHWLIPQVPNVPPLTATALAAAGVYVKLAAKVTEPLPCVATDAVAWQSLHTAPAPVLSSGAARASCSPASSRSRRGTPCSCSSRPRAPCSRCTRGSPPSSARCCGRWLTPQVPNVPPLTATALAAAGVYVKLAAEGHRPVAVRRHRRRRVAVVARRPEARPGRQVRAVRVGRQRRRGRAVALRAAVRPAAEHRVPGVPEIAAALCPLLWQMLTPQVPNVPPLTATALAAAGVYVKLAVEGHRAVAVRGHRRRRVAVVARRPEARPASSGAARASWSPASSSVAPWHSVQLFVPPPSTVFQVYPRIAAELCPLLWQRLTPQVPNVPPLTATALAAAGVYVKLAVEGHRPVRVRRHRRRRVAVVARRPEARQRRQVRPVRVGRQRRRGRAVALRAAVRPAAQLRAPRVRREPSCSARCCGRG